MGGAVFVDKIVFLLLSFDHSRETQLNDNVVEVILLPVNCTAMIQALDQNFNQILRDITERAFSMMSLQKIMTSNKP